MFHSTVPQFVKMLENLSHFLDKAGQHAEAKKFDPEVLLNSRLAPDQFHFTRQVQVVCDTAKGCVARVTGKEIPKHEDNEKTLEDLRQRIKKTVTFLKTFKPEDFRDCENKSVKLPYPEGKYLPAAEYVTEMATPNFYFHLTTAYAILRHNGVDLGKMDYLGNIKFRDR